MGNLGSAFVEILPNLKKWGARLKADIIKASDPELAAGERKFKSFSDRVRGHLGGIKVAMGAAFGAAGIGVLAKFGLSTAASLQQAQISFETLLGSANKATTFIDDLKTFASATPFELPGLIDSARQLLGAGAAAKDVIPTLRAYGDASGALGLGQESFQRIMLAVTQSMNKGKIQAEELMQITEAGIPVYPLLAKALGKPVAEIQKLASDGKLLAKDVLPLLQAQMSKEYGGAMGKQAMTLNGLWSTFMDTLRLGLSDALQPLIPTLGTLLPAATSAMSGALKAVAGGFNTFVLGIKAMIAAFREGDVTSDGFVGAMEMLGNRLREIVGVGQALIAWYREHKTAADATTAAIVAMFLAYKGYNLAVTALTAVKIAMLAFRASVISTTVAMLANPIGIIVLLIVGLVAALVVLYQRNETVRNVILTVWAAIKTAISATITFLTPYWNSFFKAMQDVGKWAMWLWHNAITPSFAAIQIAVGYLVKYVQFYFNVWVATFRIVASVATWLWKNIIGPTFTNISIAAKILWAALQIAFGAIRIQLKIMGTAFQFMWAIIRPVLNAVGVAIRFLYNATVKPYLQLMGKIISGTWNGVIKPVFNALRDFIANRVAPAFTTGVNAIAAAWNKVKEAAKAPIRFVVNTVINNGIIDAYNKIAGVFGVNKVGHIALPKGFARGGKVNTPTAIVGEGNTSRPEYVIPTDPKHRSRALSLYSELGTQLMAGGGIIGKIKDVAGDTIDFFTDPMGTAKKVFKGSLDKLNGLAQNPFAQMIGKAPVKLVDGILGFLKKKAGGIFGIGGGDIGGFGFQKQMAILRTRFPGLQLISGFRPGAITATGNPSWHGKGRAVDIPPRMDVFNWIASNFGKKTKELIFSPAGMNQIHNGARHMYSGITRAMHFDHVHWAYDQGGILPPGGVGFNGTRKPERVLPPGEDLGTILYNAMMRALADAGVGAVEVHVDGEEFKKVIKVVTKKELATSASALKVGRR